MQNRIRIARGTTSQITASQQFAEVGQPFYDTDKGYLYIGQGRGKTLPVYTEDDSVTSNRIQGNKGTDKEYCIRHTDATGMQIYTESNGVNGLTVSKKYKVGSNTSTYTLMQSRIDATDGHAILAMENAGELLLKNSSNITKHYANKTLINGTYTISSSTTSLSKDLITIDPSGNKVSVSTGSIDLPSVNAGGNVLPISTNSYSLGSSSNKWSAIYGTTINASTVNSTNIVTTNITSNLDKTKQLSILSSSNTSKYWDITLDGTSLVFTYKG